MRCTKIVEMRNFYGTLLPFMCIKDAVTFHGITTTTHGYCAEHRCCGKCGLQIKECDCKSGVPTERHDYLRYLNNPDKQ